MSGASVAGLVGTAVAEPATAVEESVVTSKAPRAVRGVRSRRATGTRSARTNSWTKKYFLALLGVDFLAATLAAVTAYLVRFPEDVAPGSLVHNYVLATLLLPWVWLLALAAADAYESRIFGLGPDEFQRPVRGVVILLALVGVGSYAAQLEVARGYVVIALPMTLLLTLIGRYSVRKRLHHLRSRGRIKSAVIAVGDVESVVDLARRLHAEKYLGMQVVGACIPRNQLTDADTETAMADVRVAVLGDLESVTMCVSRARADAVAVASTREIGPKRLRELSWELERSHVDLMVAPGLVEIAGPRLHVRPISGLPLLHIEKPEFTGANRVLKSLFDRSSALLGGLLLAPLLAGVWLAIRLSSTGPAFFRQVRVGKDGKEFQIWKFRSMYLDAEARLAELEEQNEHLGDGMFKIRQDPRITRIGRFIRRYSIDELPQLFNVFNGTMSLVGPRPPLPSEVARYEFDARRRLLVRPGLTGLWQVSGRSDLSWEETVRLDLRYVENWSLGQDALILWKTAAAVAKGSGAY